MTACAALNDFVPLSRSNTNSLELFQSPTDFSAIRIYHNLTYMTDVDWGYLTELVPLLGEYFDVDNRVVFGFGFIVFDRNY